VADDQPADKAFLSARLPAAPHNGLPAAAPQLLAQFLGGARRTSEPVYAVVRLDAGGLDRDRHTEQLVPIARVLAIEPLLDDASIEAARGLLRGAYQKRTGAQEPLFDI
jgi:hypothetical protein